MVYYINSLYSQNNLLEDLHIDNVKKLKYIGSDSVDIYAKKYPAGKYMLTCKCKHLIKSSRKKRVYRKGTITFFLYVYNDSSNEIRDNLLNDVYACLGDTNKVCYTKDIYIKNDENILMFRNCETGNYGDYSLFWYNNKIYKFVNVESSTFFIKNIGGFPILTGLLSFKGKTGFVNFQTEIDKRGLEAYNVFIKQYLKH